jgi:hypothetical protein
MVHQPFFPRIQVQRPVLAVEITAQSQSGAKGELFLRQQAVDGREIAQSLASEVVKRAAVHGGRERLVPLGCTDSGLHWHSILCHGECPRGLPRKLSHTKASPAGCARGEKALLRILGMPVTVCDGITRRDLLKVGALALCGQLVELAPGLADEGQRRHTGGRARSVILLDLFGGPSHLDTLDMKPGAPPEIRGEFRPIATSVPDVQICEHLPRLARLMHRACLIRTVSHGYNSHNPYAVMTGYTAGNDREDYFAKPSPSSDSWHASRQVRKSSGVGRRLLTSVSTTLSAITARNSSMRSRASDGFPCRPV